jgi:hypothetical protein
MGATELLCTLISSPVAAPNRCIMFMIIFTSVLPSFTKACIALAIYNATFDLAVPVCSLTCLFEVLLTHVPIHLRILVQDNGVACLTDTCRVKDPDRALISQFIIIHGLHPTCKDRTKKMY